MGVSNREFEICDKSEENVELKVRFRAIDQVIDALDDLSQLKNGYKLWADINLLRKISSTTDGKTYLIPTSINLPKARWIMASASATFPNGVDTTTIERITGLSQNEISAYCTSKNNPTSKFLYITNHHVYTSPDGIDWVIGLMKKDKQLEN